MSSADQIDDLLKVLTTSGSLFGAGLIANTKFLKEVLALQERGKKLTLAEFKVIEQKIKADEDYAEKVKRRAENITEGTKKLRDTAYDAAKQMGSLASGIAASDQSFAALVPVVNMVGNVAKGVTEALGKMLSGISIFGFSTGRASEGLAQMAGVGIDLVTSAMTQQLENSQRLVNTYQQISKTGITFGGSLEAMRDSAQRGGMAIDTYGKFITQNIENLSVMGGSIVGSADRITKLGKTISDGNPKLLAMYGTYDALQGATADYMAMQAKYGVDVTKSNKNLTNGAEEYLYNMKELSALTGKSAEALKKSEEERQSSAAYQIAMMKMEPEQRENTRKAIELIEKNYGKDAAKVAQESVARNGQIISETGLAFRNFNPALAGTIQDMLTTTKQGRVEFNKDSAELIQSRQGRIKDEAMAQAHLVQLQAGGVKDAVLEMQNGVISSVLRGQSSQADIIQTTEQLEKERKATITGSTKIFADSIKSMEGFKQKMDDLTLKNLPKMGEMMNVLYSIAEKSIGLLDNMQGAGMIILETFDKAAKELLSAIKKINGEKTAGGVAEQIDKERNDQDYTDVEGGLHTIKGTQSHAALSRSMRYTQNATPGAGTLSVSQEDLGKTLKLAHPDSAEGKVQGKDKTLDAATIRAAGMIQDLFGGTFGGITGMNDDYHNEHASGSDHVKGQAFDFITNPAPKNAEDAARLKEMIIQELRSVGLKPKQVLDEYFADKGPNTTAGHFHVALEKFAKGGITSGPSIAGEAGPEAVVPLPDGRTIPVKMDMTDLVEKLEELISVAKDHRDNSEKLLWANS